MRSPSSNIHLTELERQLERLRHEVSDTRAGLFGPDSKLWEVNRESILFLGSGRAALLQLAHPYVAAAIHDHSSTDTDPLGRFHRTFANVFDMVFGDLDTALQAARKVHRVHEHIVGRLEEEGGAWPAGSAYRANEPHGLLWVHSTLWETSILIFETLVRRLETEEKERYYAETRRFYLAMGFEPLEEFPSLWGPANPALQLIKSLA